MLNLPNLDEKLKPVKLSYRFYWLPWKELIKPTRRDSSSRTACTTQPFSHQLFSFVKLWFPFQRTNTTEKNKNELQISTLDRYVDCRYKVSSEPRIVAESLEVNSS